MPSVLVVDDSATQLALMKAVLVDQVDELHTAANGLEAIKTLQDCDVDLVVTDMQMPERNGLDLIREMRVQCPMVPAVLVTAYGNEDLAADALGVGAANYIAKEHLSVLLPETVHRILQFTRANADALLLKGALTRSRFEFLIDCSFDRITPLLSLQVRLLAAMNVLHTSDRVRMAEAIQALLFHSILHGNLGHPPRAEPFSLGEAESILTQLQQEDATRDRTQRCVSIGLKVGNHKVRFVVTHEGGGPTLDHAPLPGTPQSFADERGRVMMLLTSVMNEVFIDPVSGDITLVKYLDH